MKPKLLLLLTLVSTSLIFPTKALAFRFVAWADTKGGTSTLKAESPEVAALNPVFTIFPGDVCDAGPNASCFATWQNAFNGGSTPGNGLLNKSFITRGNHDSDGTAFWLSTFNVAATATRVGVTNLSQLNTNLTYSFDYENSHFAGVDLPAGGVASMSSAQISWLDADLTAAENRGLTHAFLFWHGPVYPVGPHCCESNPALNTMLDKHKIVSAIFVGHEHDVAYVHMDSSRYGTITHPYEQIVSGDAGAGPNSSMRSDRYDWWLGMFHGFASIDVNGNSYTVNFYKLGTATPVKTYNFSNGGTNPTPTPTKTPTGTPSPTGSSKTGDINGDGRVDIVDIGIIIDNYNKIPITNPKCDLNKDGKVDIVDIGIIVDNYNK